jgi:hypothetical protein
VFTRQFLARGKILVLAIGLSACAAVFFASVAWAQGRGGGRHGGGDSSKQSDADSGSSYKPPPASPPLSPHGGWYVSTDQNCYEVVYMPLQTRIYLYDNKLKPLSARDVHAQMILQLPTENAPRRVPFQYAAMPPGATEQDYVTALFDIRPLQDKETNITLEFSGLPDHRPPTVSFTPHYAQFSVRPYVTKVLLTEADRNGVLRQQVCPVSGAPLGSRGPITKLYIADFPLYLAGDDCIAAVQQAPEKFLPQPVMPIPGR